MKSNMQEWFILSHDRFYVIALEKIGLNLLALANS